MKHTHKTLNSATILGCIGKEPEVRYVPSGAAVCSLSLATSSTHKTDEGKKDRTIWIPVVVWGPSAEYIGKYAKKGARILVCGTINNTRWTDKEGKTRYTVEVVAEHVQILDDGGHEDALAHADQERATVEDDLPW